MLEKLPEGFGNALIRQRAGMDKLVCNHWLARSGGQGRLDISSSSFMHEGELPRICTADGQGLSPALAWGNLPVDAEECAWIVEDADAPTPRPLVHAILVGLTVEIRMLEEGALNSPHHAGLKVPMGRNSYLRQAWLPPDPPPGHGVHRYVFQLFALRAGGKCFSSNPGRGEFSDLIQDRAIALGTLIGTYQRQGKSGGQKAN